IRPRLLRSWFVAGLLLSASGCASLAASAGRSQLDGPQTFSGIGARIDSIFGQPAFAQAQWGVLIRSIDPGAVDYSRNAGRLFVPASNLKLVTGAAALETLGPDYRYRTPIASGGPISGDALEGPLVVIGS